MTNITFIINNEKFADEVWAQGKSVPRIGDTILLGAVVNQWRESQKDLSYHWYTAKDVFWFDPDTVLIVLTDQRKNMMRA